jgi:hypothetical protein
MTETTKALPDVLGAAGRTFWIDATGLVPARSWQRTSDAGKNATNRFSCEIRGVANEQEVFERFKYRATRFHLTLRSNEFLIEEWNLHVANRPNYVPSTCWADDPPTASAFQEDREPAEFKEWCIECAVPPALLKVLETDIATGGLKQVSMAINWAAPQGDALYYGRVESVHWTVPAGKLKAAETAEAENRADSRLREHLDRSLFKLFNYLTFGFIAVFALLLIGDLRVVLSGWGYAAFSVGIAALAISISWRLNRTIASHRAQQQARDSAAQTLYPDNGTSISAAGRRLARGSICCERRFSVGLGTTPTIRAPSGISTLESRPDESSSRRPLRRSWLTATDPSRPANGSSKPATSFDS